MAAIIYGIVFAQREARIRAYLRTSSRGLIRWLYVRALLQAVRGDAAVAASRYALLLLLFLAIAASTAFSVVANHLQSAQATQITNLATLYQRLDSPSQDSREAIRKNLDTLKAEIDALGPGVERTVMLARAIATTLYIIFWFGWLLWKPYVLLRARFAHEIARFSMRVQGLASPEELATLAAAELAVDSDSTLKHYVDVMKQVAAKRGIDRLTGTLDLWSQ